MNSFSFLVSIKVTFVRIIADIIKSVSDAPQTNYMVKIESLSLLTKHAIERYETEIFEAGGYKW